MGRGFREPAECFNLAPLTIRTKNPSLTSTVRPNTPVAAPSSQRFRNLRRKHPCLVAMLKRDLGHQQGRHLCCFHCPRQWVNAFSSKNCVTLSHCLEPPVRDKFPLFSCRSSLDLSVPLPFTRPSWSQKILQVCTDIPHSARGTHWVWSGQTWKGFNCYKLAVN